MFRNSRLTRSVLPCLAAPVLFCAMAALGPAPAHAQSFDDLDCGKCVDTDEFAKKAVTKSQIEKETISTNRIKDGTVGESKLSTDLQEHFAGRESFYITLDVGSATSTTKTIATHGPLSLVARCLVDQPASGGGLEDRIEIYATSSASGWFEEDESDELAGNPPLNAGEQVISVSVEVNPTGRPRFDGISETSVVAPDGSYLALTGDAGGMGLNMFGHDCVVMGNVYRVTGTL